jgi:crotonobetainyl-CoA:carnitine CoA-transferase CaiB-like acyl-CoA transferase
VLLLLLVALIGWRFRRPNKHQPAPLAPQRERWTAPAIKPGNGAPIMTGIRVVELANTVAAPNAAKLLGELGAEVRLLSERPGVTHVRAQVFKCEPPAGDEYRKFYSLIQRGRPQSVCFDWVNANKSSVVVDYATAKGQADLRRLLQDADVLITNVRSWCLADGVVDDSLVRSVGRTVFARPVWTTTLSRQISPSWCMRKSAHGV